MDRPGLDILGKLSHQMLSAASILGNLYFHQMVCRSSQSLVLSLDGSQESKSLFLGVWQHKDQLAIHYKGPSREVQKNLSGGVQVARCDV